MKESRHFKEVVMYEYGDFFVEITVSHDDYEAWIRHKDYGVAQLMFGIPKYEDGNHTKSYGQFKEIVIKNLDEYIELYREEYMND